ncbi:MAG: phosphoribosyltransferase [Desulfurococcales archaeon]|nr:phosphoribosyltransferase [Desulfurococcales archaeon]
MNFLPVTWDDVHVMSLKIARKVIRDGYVPDAIVGILRGGFIIARIIADVLGIEDLGTVEVKFYKGIAEPSERPVITQPLTLDVRDKKVLIVDDVVDSGRTLEVATEQVRLRGASTVKSAALFAKPKSIIFPDFYIKLTTEWVLFPWELGEFLKEFSDSINVDNIKERLKKVGLNVSDELLTELAGVLKERSSK